MLPGFLWLGFFLLLTFSVCPFDADPPVDASCNAAGEKLMRTPLQKKRGEPPKRIEARGCRPGESAGGETVYGTA